MKYICKGKTYEVLPCTSDDIPSHIERVLSYWKKDTSITVDIQKERMLRSIKLGLAFKCNDSAVYLENRHKMIATGIYANFIIKPEAFILGKHLLYKNIDTVLVYPHTDDIPFKFAFSDQELARYNIVGPPIVINLRSKKITEYYNGSYKVEKVD